MRTQERAPRVEVERPRCPFCHADVGADDPKTACEACMAWHHRGCWTEHGRCSGCGAGQAAGAAPVVAAPAAPAPTAEPGRFSLARQHDPFLRGQRGFGWLLVALGASNVLLFGGLLVWSLVTGADLVALSATFVLLGAPFVRWGVRLLGETRPRPLRSRDAAKR